MDSTTLDPQAPAPQDAPATPSSEQRKWYKKKRFIIPAAAIIAWAAFGMSSGDGDSSPTPSASTSSASSTSTAVEEQSDAADLTVSQENAIESAETYLDLMAFSRSGLINQLEFEGYSTEDATFAVDYLSPDWNAEAAESAENYLDVSSFSRSGLIDQLMFEGFTQAQAEYGVSQVGL